MPNIHQADFGQLGIQGNDRPADARQQAGRTIAGFHNQVADDQRAVGAEFGTAIEIGGKAAVDYLDSQEIGNGAAKFAELQLTLSQQWDQTLKGADPNDPAVASSFRESVVEPALERFTSGFNTRNSQDWASGRIANMREHFWKKTAADQSTLAAVAVRDNLRTLANTYSTSAALDPASTKETLLQARSDLEALINASPTLSAEHRTRLLEEVGTQMGEKIAKAGIVSAINQNPDAGLKLAGDPELAKYIDGGDVNQFYAQAKRNEKTDMAFARQQQRDALEERSKANLTNVIQNLYDPEQTAKVTTKQIAQIADDQMVPSDRLHAIRIIEAELKPQAASAASAVVSSQALTGIRTGTMTLNEIYKLKEENQITREDFKFLSDQYVNYRDESGGPLNRKRSAFIDAFKGAIDSSNPFTHKVDEAGKRHLWEFEQELSRREGELRAAGRDPHMLYDPRAPEYMGSPAALAPYKKSAAEEQAAFFNTLPRIGDSAPVMPSQKYKIGQIINGRRFNGGDWKDPANYTDVRDDVKVPDDR